MIEFKNLSTAWLKLKLNGLVLWSTKYQLCLVLLALILFLVLATWDNTTDSWIYYSR